MYVFFFLKNYYFFPFIKKKNKKANYVLAARPNGYMWKVET
jgi:hypothetical protein